MNRTGLNDGLRWTEQFIYKASFAPQAHVGQSVCVRWTTWRSMARTLPVDGALLIIEVFLGIREGERDPENVFGGIWEESALAHCDLSEFTWGGPAGKHKQNDHSGFSQVKYYYLPATLDWHYIDRLNCHEVQVNGSFWVFIQRQNVTWKVHGKGQSFSSYLETR